MTFPRALFVRHQNEDFERVITTSGHSAVSVAVLLGDVVPMPPLYDELEAQLGCKEPDHWMPGKLDARADDSRARAGDIEGAVVRLHGHVVNLGDDSRIARLRGFFGEAVFYPGASALQDAKAAFRTCADHAYVGRCL